MSATTSGSGPASGGTSSSTSSEAHIQIYRGIDEEFKLAHLPLSKLNMKDLSDWAKQQATDPTTMLFVLVDINVTATPGNHRRFWVFLTGDPFHVRGQPFNEHDIKATVFDVTAAYQSGFGGVLKEGVRVKAKESDILTDFYWGRLYQAADEAARRGDTGVLGELLLRFCMPIAKRMGTFYDF